jgi:hypothetical protein
MKTFISSLKYVLTAGLLVVGVILALPAVPVFAEPPIPSIPAPQTAHTGKRLQNQLERVFSRQGAQLGKLASRLQNTAKITDRAQKRIDALKAKGMDTSALESALVEFKNSVTAAQNEHDQAAAIHSSAAGFDANGKVTDISQAIQTAHTTQDHLVACRRGLEDAVQQMIWAVMQARLSLISKNSDH